MIPRSDADAPSLDPSALRRLKTLDPNLVVTWRRHVIDPLTDEVIVAANPATDPMTGVTPKAGPIECPLFHLWRRDDNSSHHFWVLAFPFFDERIAARLEADLARFMDPAEIPRLIRERAEARAAAKQASQKDDVAALTRANWTKIKRSFEGDDKDTRGAKLISGPGLTKRSTPGDVPLTPKEAGWESPAHTSERSN